MKITPFLCYTFALFFLPSAVLAEPGREAVEEVANEIARLEANKKNLSSEELAGETQNIFKKLEGSSSGDDKLVVSTVAEVSQKFTLTILEYNKFLGSVSHPDFFNFEKAEDPTNLEQQILTAQEYLRRSQEMVQVTDGLQANMAAALRAKGVREDQIKSVLKGIKDSEARTEKTPSRIMRARTEHAGLLLKGLQNLKAWQGRWRFDRGEENIKFNTAREAGLWNKEIVEPLGVVEKFLS